MFYRNSRSMFGEVLQDSESRPRPPFAKPVGLASSVVYVWCWQRITAEVRQLSIMLRRRHQSRRLFVFVLFTICLYHLMISTISKTRRARRGSSMSLTSHFLFEGMHGDVNESSNFTKRLWLFNNSDAERIYLYANILDKHQRKASPQYLDSFRRELNAESNVSTDRDLILTQTNVKLGQELICYVVTKTFWSQKHFVVTEKFLSTLPQESPMLGKRYERCAIVGNSGSLQNSSCGSEIDGMDFVFRCNGAPLRSFIKDAGRRTDFVSFNPSILYKQFGGLENESMVETYIEFMNQYDSLVWYPCFGSRKLVDPCLKALSYRDRIHSQLVIGHPTHYVSIWEFWKRRGLKKKPSTGLYLMNVAATMCKEIHLYGFWPFPVELREARIRETAYHYFNSIPFTSHHSSDAEFRILLQMHMLGAINLHTGTCEA